MWAGRIGTALLVIATLCLASVSVGEAGGGMGQGSGTTTCRLVQNSLDQPQTMSVIDQFTGGDIVNVGSAVLVCDLAALATTLKGPLTTPLGTTPTAVVCYSVGASDPSRVETTLLDPFGEQAVTLGAIQLLCVPATVTYP